MLISNIIILFIIMQLLKKLLDNIFISMSSKAYLPPSFHFNAERNQLSCLQNTKKI